MFIGYSVPAGLKHIAPSPLIAYPKEVDEERIEEFRVEELGKVRGVIEVILQYLKS